MRWESLSSFLFGTHGFGEYKQKEQKIHQTKHTNGDVTRLDDTYIRPTANLTGEPGIQERQPQAAEQKESQAPQEQQRPPFEQQQNKTTRSGRAIKIPSKYNDFLME
ncbi:Uncharacterised protein r2_g2940 [Pycnogonum litorale]